MSTSIKRSTPSAPSKPEEIDIRVIRASLSRRCQIDTFILATGFDVVPGDLTALDVQGIDSVALRQKCQPGLEAHPANMTNGFPDVLFVQGPLAPASINNGPGSSKRHGDGIIALLVYLRDRNRTRIESTADADRCRRERIDDYAMTTLFGRAGS